VPPQAAAAAPADAHCNTPSLAGWMMMLLILKIRMGLIHPGVCKALLRDTCWRKLLINILMRQWPIVMLRKLPINVLIAHDQGWFKKSITLEYCIKVAHFQSCHTSRKFISMYFWNN
jgi:hypothetical protein